ncbi:MAG: GxxExxY protein [Ferruginibacter sp.]|nr:GxxExxY protein [Chitinophagaceae bacterium]
MKHEKLTEQIIKAFYNVYNGLGYGFLEKVYENAMCIELTEMGLKVDRQRIVAVYYKQHAVGDYFADLTVEDTVICELKTHERLSVDNEYQLINYLKATSIETGLLLNFGKKPEIRRKIYDNEKKAWYTTRITSL